MVVVTMAQRAFAVFCFFAADILESSACGRCFAGIGAKGKGWKRTNKPTRPVTATRGYEAHGMRQAFLPVIVSTSAR